MENRQSLPIENPIGCRSLMGKLQTTGESSCPRCGEGVEMLTAEAAVGRTGVPLRVIHRWLEDEQIHSLKPAEGEQLLCLPSLRKVYADTLKETKQVRAINRASLISEGTNA
jgi:hypothetical protein